MGKTVPAMVEFRKRFAPEILAEINEMIIKNDLKKDNDNDNDDNNNKPGCL